MCILQPVQTLNVQSLEWFSQWLDLEEKNRMASAWLHLFATIPTMTILPFACTSISCMVILTLDTFKGKMVLPGALTIKIHSSTQCLCFCQRF